MITPEDVAATTGPVGRRPAIDLEARQAAEDPDPARPRVAYFRAVALDFDGTLASDGQVSPDALAALDDARARGIRVVLVTGRILDELREAFPSVDVHVDAIVAENGAVLSHDGMMRLLAAPIDLAVGAALTTEGIAWRAGRVLIACSASAETVALGAIDALGLDCQLVRNRSELMILPAGVTKGTGLVEVLGDLGLSVHNTIGVGDAENDHTLLSACELGIAVADAVEALRRHADVILDQPDGAGVASLLRGGLLAGTEHVHPRRWQITLGVDDDGRRVSLPSSQLNVVIAGGTGDGKSYVAGLIAEQLVALGYSVLVFDPEGDHVGLGLIRGVLVAGGDGRLPEPAEVARLIRHHNATVVIDLSNADEATQSTYLQSLPPEIEALRSMTGLPQWVLMDEAHGPLGRGGSATPVFSPAAKGYLLVTWRPQDLSADALAGVDAVIALSTPQPDDQLVGFTAAVAEVSQAEIAGLLARPSGQAVLAWRRHPRQATLFTPGARRSPHLRHEHKYGAHGVEPARRFTVRTEGDTLTGAVIANLSQLENELLRCDRGVFRHHCPHHDFSRWIATVFYDDPLAERIAAAEEQVTPSSPAAVVEACRVEMIAALQGRRPG